MILKCNRVQNGSPWRPILALWLLALMLLLPVTTLHAFETVKISRGDTALDLTATTSIYPNQGEAFQVTTAAGTDGIRRRIEVQAGSLDHHGDWAVFALANVSDEQLERVIVAPHFRLSGSGLFWPDLGSRRILSITPSEGFALDRIPSQDADIFRITLDPGTVVTFVAELATPSLPQLYLWKPNAYKDTQNAFTLYRGIVLGIAGLLAVFLTVLFIVRGMPALPAAVLAWAVLAYVCVDFNLAGKLIGLTAGDLRSWRAATELGLALCLAIFLFAYLNLNRWHASLGHATFVWVAALGFAFGLGIYDDPAIAAGIARLSLALTAAAGAALIVYLGFNRCDRAILLVPAWTLILVWLFGAWLTVTGRLDNDIVQPALDGGLVLVVLLIGFTVMQYALVSGTGQQGFFSDLERRSLALEGSGDTVWDWNVSRDRIVTSPDIALSLGLAPGSMHTEVSRWLLRLHPDDRDKFRTSLDTLLERCKGRLDCEFRMRSEEGYFRWLRVKARPVLGSNGEVARCVGTIADVTEHKDCIGRLLWDAMHDTLTGLPNRQIFLDRLQSILTLAAGGRRLRPTVLVIGLDRRGQISDSFGAAASGDTLIALARRLRRLSKPRDTLARLSDGEFGFILMSERDPAGIADFSKAVRNAVMTPFNLDNHEIVLEASIGLATLTDPRDDAAALLSDAELAVCHARKSGGNRIEPFPSGFP